MLVLVVVGVVADVAEIRSLSHANEGPYYARIDANARIASLISIERCSVRLFVVSVNSSIMTVQNECCSTSRR